VLLPLGGALLAEDKPLDIIDCHTHFYDPSRPQGVPWPGKTSQHYRIALPHHLKQLKTHRKVTGTVIVEASAWVEDNQWLLDLAKNEPFIVGIVGRLHPGSAEFAKNVERFKKNELFRGIRSSAGLVNKLLDAGKLDDFKRLADADLVLDVNTSRDNPSPQCAARLAKAVPDLRIVINHCGGARIADAGPDPDWTKGIHDAAKQPNVSIKISALVESAFSNSGKVPRTLDLYRPYLDVIYNAFGEDRVMYGSNWPVSDMAADYETLQGIIMQYMAEKGDAPMRKYCALNAKKIYKWVERPGRLK
jgi:predicted TIM-barrel fold metal-dependent hydrolase